MCVVCLREWGSEGLCWLGGAGGGALRASWRSISTAALPVFLVHKRSEFAIC